MFKMSLNGAPPPQEKKIKREKNKMVYFQNGSLGLQVTGLQIDALFGSKVRFSQVPATRRASQRSAMVSV